MGFFQKIFGTGKKTVDSPPSQKQFKVPRVDVSELENYPDAIGDIFHQKIDGIVVSNALPLDVCREAVKRMEASETEIMNPSAFGKVLGQPLVASDEDLSHYMAQNESLATDLSGMFGKSFPELVTPVLQKIAGDRDVSVPVHPDKGDYKAATVRFMYPGMDDIEAHVGNEFITELPQYQHLISLLHLQDQLSYFMLLQAPEEGGELVLFDLSWEDTPRDLVHSHGITRVPGERKAYLEKVGKKELKLKAGDLIVFHGGRIWHKVNAVRGSVHRVTIGGFASVSLDNQHVYYWS